MYVKPANGLKVRDPFKKDHLPTEGRVVPDLDLDWQRLLADGDVVETAPPANVVRETTVAAALVVSTAAPAAASTPAVEGSSKA
ncbi:MAG: DUF2635 domain-containing protein [Clostridiaceae bacterium]|nr:DUF2635 domain-containing protein [Clostridiaceae bacterium]